MGRGSSILVSLLCASADGFSLSWQPRARIATRSGAAPVMFGSEEAIGVAILLGSAAAGAHPNPSGVGRAPLVTSSCQYMCC